MIAVESDPTLMGIFINSLPMLLLLIGVWIIFMRRAGIGGRLSKFQAEYLEEMRKQTQIQERIASALEKDKAQ